MNVHGHSSQLWNEGEAAVVIFKVERRSPVDRAVLRNRAACAVGIHQITGGSGEVEVYTGHVSKLLYDDAWLQGLDEVFHVLFAPWTA